MTAKPEQRESGSSGRTLRLLIIEDSPAEAELLTAELKRAGSSLSFEIVDSAEEFQQRLNRTDYDLILSDHKLRDGTGLEALKILRQSAKDIPFVVVTATLGDSVAVEYIKGGATDYVLKDRLERLPSVVERALSEKALREKSARLNEQLLNSRREWEMTFDSIPDAVIVLDSLGCVRRVNRAAMENLGLKEFSDLLGKSCSEIIQGLKPEAPGCPECSLWQTGKAGRAEMEEPRLGKTFDVTCMPFHDSSGAIHSNVLVLRDITERKRVEKALSASEERYRSLLEAAPDAVVSVDSQGRILIANAQAEKLFGYRRDELLGQPLEILLPERFRDNHISQRAQYSADPHVRTRLMSQRLALQGRRKDGTDFPAEISLSSTNTPDGLVVTSIINDITERKQAEESMRLSEERFRLLVEQAADAFFVHDADGKFTDVNRHACESLGYSRDELLQMSVTDIALNADMDLLRKRWNQMQPNQFITVDGTHRRKDGTMFPVEVRLSRFDLGGEPVFLDLVRDISRRKAAEADLKEKEENFRLLFASNPLPMWVRDAETLQFVEVNEAAISHYGYSRDEFLGMKTTDIRPPEDVPRYLEVCHQFRDVVKNHGQWRHRLKDGRIIDVESVSHQLQLRGRRTVLVVINDITERKRTEEALAASEVRYRRLFEAAKDGILILDAETGAIVDANPFLEKLLDYSREELLGKKLWEIGLFKDKVRSKAAFKELQEGGNIRYENLPLESRDGFIRYVEFVSNVYQVNHTTVIQCNIRDITDRKRAEDALRRQLRLDDAFFNESVSCFVLLDSDFNFIRVNEAYAKACRRKMEDFPGRNHFEFFPSDAKSIFDGVIRTKKLFQTEARPFTFADQPERGVTYWDWALVPILDESGEVEFLLFSLNDVTDRKRAEDALRESQERLELAIRASNTGLWDWDLVNNKVFFSPEWKRQIGYEDHEIGNSAEEWINRLHPDDHDRVLAIVSDHQANSQGEYGVEFRLQHKDGSYRWIIARGTTLRNAAGKPYRMIGSHIDISDRKIAEQALRGSEEKYRRIVEIANEGILMIDRDGKIVLANRQMAKMLGWSEEDMSRLTLFDLTNESDLPDARARLERRRQGGSEQYEVRYRRKDGSEFLGLASVTSLIDEGGAFVGTLGMITDITEWKRLENQFRQAQKMEAVGRLAGGIAHDFNNMLNIILGYAQLMRERLKPEDPMARMVDQIQKAGERAAALTRQLLAFSRKQVLQPKIVDLNAVVSETATMIRQLIGEDIEVVEELDPALGSVKADPGQLGQVIMNLAVNARDAMPNGGKFLISTANDDLDESYTQMRQLVSPGPYVRLTVKDTGIGMDQETQSHIFEPFFTTKEAGKGTGLGLATVYGTIKQSEGYIWVYSEPGKGTTFKIYFPRVNEAAEGYESRSAQPPSVEGHETILIVEDEKGLRELTREFLSGGGYTLLDAKDGPDGLELAAKHKGPIHLLLTDVVMPGMSGRELVKCVVATHPEIKVLLVSGYSDKELNHRGDLEPGAAFLEKPFSKNDLIRKVRELLDAPPVTEGTK